MAKIMSKKEISHIISVRILIMVAVNLVGIATLFALRREAMVELSFVNHWLTPLAIVFGVLSALAATYQVLAIVKKADTSRHYVTPAMLLCVALFCLVACLVYKHVIVGTLVLASIIGTVLFSVYCLYVHIFYR